MWFSNYGQPEKAYCHRDAILTKCFEVWCGTTWKWSNRPMNRRVTAFWKKRKKKNDFSDISSQPHWENTVRQVVTYLITSQCVGWYVAHLCCCGFRGLWQILKKINKKIVTMSTESTTEYVNRMQDTVRRILKKPSRIEKKGRVDSWRPSGWSYMPSHSFALGR